MLKPRIRTLANGQRTLVIPFDDDDRTPFTLILEEPTHAGARGWIPDLGADDTDATVEVIDALSYGPGDDLAVLEIRTAARTFPPVYVDGDLWDTFAGHRDC